LFKNTVHGAVQPLFKDDGKLLEYLVNFTVQAAVQAAVQVLNEQWAFLRRPLTVQTSFTDSERTRTRNKLLSLPNFSLTAALLPIMSRLRFANGRALRPSTHG
jgi:hypothetical protein